MRVVIILGSNHANTSRYHGKLNLPRSQLVLAREHSIEIGHTSVQDVPDITVLESILADADTVFWAHPSLTEFDSASSYFRFLEWLKVYQFKHKNIQNFSEISFDLYNWNKAMPALTEDDLVILGASTAAGVGIEDYNDRFSVQVANHFKKNLINIPEMYPGLGTNDRTFDFFSTLDFVPGQIVIIHVAPLERMRYCTADVALTDLQFTNIPRSLQADARELVQIYNQKFLFYRLVRDLRMMIKYSRLAKLKLVFFLDNYKNAQSISFEDQMYFYDMPEYVPRLFLQDSFIDVANDNMHPGKKSNKIMADILIEHIERIYP